MDSDKPDIPDHWNVTSTEFAEGAVKICQGIVLQLEAIKPGTDIFDNHPPNGCPTCAAIHAVQKLQAFLIDKYIKEKHPKPEGPR